MKYAFMTFSCPDLTLDEALALAARHGYDGLEPRLSDKQKHGVALEADAAARQAIRKRAEDSGIRLCCVATSCRFADPNMVKEMVEEAIACIDLAADVGSPRIRVFGGSIPKGVSRQQAGNMLVESLKFLSDKAEARDVTVCVETHDDWSDPTHMADVLARVDHPFIMCNWDIMHPVRYTDIAMEEAFTTLKPWIRHVHFHDGKRDPEDRIKIQLAPIGEGFVDHRTAVKCLKQTGYDGYLSGEWINWETPYDEYLPRELATMKQYEERA